MKYTVKEDQTHGKVLCKDGKECICPFQPAIPHQNNLGGLAIMRIPCSSSCAHANFIKYSLAAGSVQEYVMTCTGYEKTIEIDEDETNNNTLKLI